MSGRPPLPAGFTLHFHRRTRFGDGGTIVSGGSPWRMLRLSTRGAAILRGLRDGAHVRDATDGALARRLVDAGLAEPQPPTGVDAGSPPTHVEVVVPVFDQPEALARCLDSLDGLPVVVIDDASPQQAAIADVVAGHGRARLVRRTANGGPAAARNTGLAETSGDVVAFVDSDAHCTPPVIAALAAHLLDPVVAAAAPRVRRHDPSDAGAAPHRGGPAALVALATARSPLDRGPDAASVRPGSPVGYVPSTVLVARRAALDEVGGFDERLRYGEDVDVGWHLVAARWDVRYDAQLDAAHEEPEDWPAWLGRRFRYGTSAGPLARRHGDALAGPALAGLVAPLSVARLFRGRNAPDLPAGPAYRAAATAAVDTLAAMRAWGLPLWWPALLVAARRGRSRTALGLVAVVPPLLDWTRTRPDVDPLRWAGACLIDDLAYGAGVWVGCVRARTTTPLLPRLGRVLSVHRPRRAHDDARLQ